MFTIQKVYSIIITACIFTAISILSKPEKEKLIELGSDIKRAPGTIKGMIKDHIIDESSNKKGGTTHD